jgi:glycosyltransferase involved in cell wall biosynthesis
MGVPEPVYTLAMCNYNMSDTLRGVIRSVLNQVDETYEMLVVDDGSTDSSLEILDGLSTEYKNLRYIALDHDSSRKLGRTRNISVMEARGDYVLPQIDADDRYDRIDGGISAFVEVFHELESKIKNNFYLSGRNINIARKEFLLEHGPYRNLPPGAEDRDLWRRLMAEGKIICIHHQKHYTPNVGYWKTWYEKHTRSFHLKKGDFQAGISLKSYMKWKLQTSSMRILPYHIVSNIVAYLLARRSEIGSTPVPFNDICVAESELKEAVTKTIEDVEKNHRIEINKSALSQEAKDMFLNVGSR